MLKDIDLTEAIKRSMQTEKNAMDFYRRGAEKMKREEAKKTFELLSREEREHAEWFWNIYPEDERPDFETFMATAPDQDSDWLSDLEKLILPDFDERKAMKLAMEKELRLEQSLRKMVERIEDPDIRRVFLANAESTHHHYELIESEYARLMGMVHETDIDTYVRE